MRRKYAIIPINVKGIGDDLYLRCVLVRYSRKKGDVYKGTKYLGCSPYFNDASKALQYKFEDKGYTLLSDGHGDSKELVMVKREYHTPFSWSGVEFVAKSDDDAKEFFESSKYYDCDSKPIKVDPNGEEIE